METGWTGENIDGLKPSSLDVRVFVWCAVEGRASRGVAAANFLKDSSRTPELLVGEVARVGVKTASGLPVNGVRGENIKLNELVSTIGRNLERMAVSSSDRIARSRKNRKDAVALALK